MTGEDIKWLRLDLGWRGSDLAHYLGVSQATISGWENNMFSPDPYREAALRQLRIRVDQQKSEQALADFVKGLKIAAVTGGVFLLLKYLFEK